MSNEDESFTVISKQLTILKEHSTKAYLRSLLPTFDDFDLEKTVRNTSFKVMMQLYLMGENGLLDKLKKASNTESFMNALYDRFSNLAENNTKENLKYKENLATLKKLKKNIHDLARATKTERRIISVKKYKIPDGGYAQRRGKIHDIGENDYHVVVKLNDLIDTDEEEKKRQERKAAKKRMYYISILVSLIVGIGEGLVATVFATATFPFTVAILAIGVPALICNFFLFKGDSYEIFKDLHFGKIWKKEDGTPLTKTQKGLVASTLVFTAAAGISFGFISFGSALTAFGHIFWHLTAAAAIAHPPIGLAVLAAIIAITTSVALFTVFSYMITKAIRDSKPGKINAIFVKLKNFYQYEDVKETRLSGREKALHIAKKTFATLIHLSFFGLAIAASTLVIIASCGLMKHAAINVFEKTFKLSAAISRHVAIILVLGLGAVCNGAFYTKGIFAIMDAVKSIPLAVINWSQTRASIMKTRADISKNSYTKFQAFKVAIQRFFLFSCIGLNGWGQAQGPANCAGAKNSVAKLFHLSSNEARTVILTSAYLGSTGPNALASMEQTRGQRLFSHKDEKKPSNEVETTVISTLEV